MLASHPLYNGFDHFLMQMRCSKTSDAFKHVPGMFRAFFFFVQLMSKVNEISIKQIRIPLKIL